jgi:hypothetical protein
MNQPRKGTEVRAFNVTRPGVEVPKHNGKRQKTVAELSAELDRVEAECCLAADVDESDEAAMVQSRGVHDPDAEECELTRLGLSTWSTGPERR